MKVEYLKDFEDNKKGMRGEVTPRTFLQLFKKKIVKRIASFETIEEPKKKNKK